MIKAEFRSAVGGQYEFISFTIEGVDQADVVAQIDSLRDETVLKIGDFHRSLSGSFELAYEKGYEAALAIAQEALGATVLETRETPAEAPQKAPVKDSAPAWQRPVQSKPKAWEAPKGMEDF